MAILAVVTPVAIAPTQSFAVGLFMEAWQEDFGSSSTEISFMLTVVFLFPAPFAGLVGGLVDRFGARRVLCGLAPLYFATQLWVSCASSYLALMCSLSLVRLLGPQILQLTARWVLQQWWDKHRGMAFGVYSSIMSFQLSFPPVFVLLLHHMTWRQIYALWSILGPAVILIWIACVHDRPESLGHHPDGAKLAETPSVEYAVLSEKPKQSDGEQDSEIGNDCVVEGTLLVPEDEQAVQDEQLSKSTVSEHKNDNDWIFRDAIKTFQFWVMVVGQMLQATYWVGMNVHVSSVLKENNLDPAAVSYLYPIATVVAQVTNLVLGRLLDTTGKKERIGAFGNAVISAGMACAANMTSIPMAVVWAVLFGFMSGMGMLFYTAMFGAWFGKKNYGAIYGFASTWGTVCAGLAPAVVGLMKDAFGSYSPALLLLATLQAIVATLFCCISEPIRQANKKNSS